MRADGSEFPVELTITRIDVPGPPMFTGYVRDITDRMRARGGAARLARADRRGGRRGAPPARARPPRRRPAAARRARPSTCAWPAAQLDARPAAARRAARRGDREELAGATDELRELARGIHPAVLTERGLGAGAARRSPAARRSRSSCRTTPDERLPPPVEAAAYFVVAEALTNVARYADARDRGRRSSVTPDGAPAWSRSATTAAAAPTRPAAPGCAGSPTASRRSTARSRSTARRARAPIVRAEIPCAS